MPLSRYLRRLVATILVVAMTVAAPALMAAQADPAADATSRPLNILLLGSDARPGEPIDGVRSDIMVVMHLDPATRACRLLSIGRDTRVEVPGIGFTKINHALMQGGVPLTIATVESYLGIGIDHFGLIDFEGASQLIDAIGGITIDNDEAFAMGSNEFPLGEQRLDGDRAVLFARYRGGEDGDIGRMHRQQMVVAAVLRELDNVSLPDLALTSLTGLNDHVMTDLPVETLTALGSFYRSGCTGDTLAVDTIPYADGGMMWDDLFGQELWFGVTDPVVVREKVHILLNGE